MKYQVLMIFAHNVLLVLLLLSIRQVFPRCIVSNADRAIKIKNGSVSEVTKYILNFPIAMSYGVSIVSITHDITMKLR